MSRMIPRRPFLRLLLGLVALLVLNACRQPPLQQQESYVFGTRVEVLTVSEDADKGRKAIATVLREFDRLHRAYHAWEPSELGALNEALQAGKVHPVTPELAALIREARQMAALGQYRFDPGIGRLIALWGFHTDEFKPQLPDPAALAAWQAARPGIADLTVTDDNRVSSRNRQVALDFGGYLKGVALDRAAVILKQQGITSALINIGGNILALGDKHGTPWKVGIQHPRQPGPLATLTLADGEAIGTSGDYQRFFELDGLRYCHLLDPQTARPVQHTAALTVVVPAGSWQGMQAGMRSDASSKPVFIAGPDGWQQAARSMGLMQVLRVGSDGKIEVTATLAKRLEWVGDAEREVRIVP